MSTRKPAGWSRLGAQAIVYAVLGVSAVVIAFPFYWMVVSTIRPEKEVYTVALNLLPSELSFAMYRKLLGDPWGPPLSTSRRPSWRPTR
jgi:multiple sugar transport system permease protein